MTRDLRWRTIAAILFLGIVSITLHGCSDQISAPQGPSISLAVSPRSATIHCGDTINLRTVVAAANSRDTSVEWAISSGSTCSHGIGAIQANGCEAFYIAPPELDSESMTVSVWVRSRVDTVQAVQTTITIVEEDRPPVRTYSIALSPSLVTLESGSSQQFTATVSVSTGTPANSGVRWKLTSGPGAVTQSGIYIAPPSFAGTVDSAIVEATAIADTTVRQLAHINLIHPRPAAPCFRTVIQPIFVSNCTVKGCHNPSDHISGFEFTTYQGLRTAVIPGDTVNSLLYTRITHVHVLTAPQISLVADWILAGAENSQCPPSNLDWDTTNVRYSNFVRPMIENYCLGCHTAKPVRLSGVDFTNYDGVADAANNGSLLGTVTYEDPYPHMPQYGAQLDAPTIAKLRAWINRGAPND